MSSSAPPRTANPSVPRPSAASRTTSPRLRWVLPVLVAAALAACGGLRAGGDGADADGARSSEPEGARFVIDSRLAGPVNVYATTGVNRVRLGTISVSQEASWPVPRDMVGRGRTVRLVLDQVGGPAVATEQFAVEAGDVVYLTVTERIFQSGATLRVQMGG